MKLDVWHNIGWSRYKAAVFTRLAELAPPAGIELRVFQVAETERRRQALNMVDMDRHRYPMELIFRGSHEAIPRRVLLWALARRAWRTSADLVILAGYDRPEYWLQALILRLRGRQIAAVCDSTLHDKPRSLGRTLLKRLFFRLCPHSFGYGERARAYAIGLGVKPQNALLRPQAADLPPDYDPARIAELRVGAAAGADAPHYLFVGRLDPEKAVDVLLRAFALVHSDRPAARLTVVGDGAEAAPLRVLAAGLGLDQVVTFAGGLGQEALPDAYLGATALVLPSRSEPWGLVVNEALHFGCPVIVSEACGCVPELVSNPACGLRVRVGDVAGLAARMVEAADRFADVRITAAACLKTVAWNTPSAAAEALIVGTLELHRRRGG